MAVQIEFDAEPPLVLFHLEGNCTGPEIAEAMRAAAGDERLKEGAPVLWDGRRIGGFYLREADVEAIVAAQRALEAALGPGSAAILVLRVEDDLAARLLVRVIESERREIRVFRDEAEALAWLGRPDYEL